MIELLSYPLIDLNEFDQFLVKLYEEKSDLLEANLIECKYLRFSVFVRVELSQRLTAITDLLGHPDASGWPLRFPFLQPAPFF